MKLKHFPSLFLKQNYCVFARGMGKNAPMKKEMILIKICSSCLNFKKIIIFFIFFFKIVTCDTCKLITQLYMNL